MLILHNHKMEESSGDLDKQSVIAKAQIFMKDGCGCRRGLQGGQCSDQFTEESVLANLYNCLELSHMELDLIVLANIQAFSAAAGPEVIGEKRKRNPPLSFLYHSQLMCKEMFLNFYGISKSRFQRLLEHYQHHGISPRVHGNSKRLPHNALPQAVTEDVKNFLSNYADENAVLLPGRIPGFKNEDIQLLSSSDTKMNVWKSFKLACEESNKQAVSYTKFIDLWKQFHPNVVVAKPMSDLCFTCQQNTSKLLRAANLPEAEKSECVKAQQEHLNSVQTEREHYRVVCEEAKCNLEAVEDQRIDLDEPHEACSVPTTMHYSFDFAQQVHYPSNPMQPGPIYFKTPRKCSIFGIMCEAIPQQVNYLIDEASDVGKGANTTISYLHHYFEHHGLGETSVHLHADNCTGQNKNNYFIWYLTWRTILQLHHSIRYSFLIAGHTKFGPDRCFGVIKKSYKLNFISSLYEFASMVESSSSGINKAQLVGKHDGTVIVPVYDWSSFLEQFFRRVPNVTRYHHFRFSKDEPGKLYFKESKSSPEQSLMLLKKNGILPSPSVLPTKLNPPGLSQERKQYLHREIRQFCKPGLEDLVAPAP